MADPDRLVDVDALLSLTSELRAVQDRLDRADIGSEQRRRWRRTLGAIAQGAAEDLDRARAQLHRLAAKVEGTHAPG